MTSRLRKRVDKLDGGGRGKVYVFEMSQGMDSKAIAEEFRRERGIEKNDNDLYIFVTRFCDTEPRWKYMGD